MTCLPPRTLWTLWWRKAHKALAQVSKRGYLYVFDRISGEPVWPIVETAVPASNVGERAAAATDSQLASTLCTPGSSVEALIDPYSAEGYGTGPLYTPPTTNGLIITPGEGGGAIGAARRLIQPLRYSTWPALDR